MLLLFCINSVIIVNTLCFIRFRFSNLHFTNCDPSTIHVDFKFIQTVEKTFQLPAKFKYCVNFPVNLFAKIYKKVEWNSGCYSNLLSLLFFLGHIKFVFILCFFLLTFLFYRRKNESLSMQISSCKNDLFYDVMLSLQQEVGLLLHFIVSYVDVYMPDVVIPRIYVLITL